MAGRSNSTSARQSGGKGRGLAFFRAAFGLLVAVTVSFALGFFVFARMVHQNSKKPQDAPVAAGTDVGTKKHTNETQTAKNENVTGNTDDTPKVKKPLKDTERQKDGPKLLPEEDGQTPGTVDPAPGRDANAADNPVGRSRTTPGGSEIQAPGSPDSPTTVPDATAVPKSGVYRVQLGVYSTRGKAEEVVEAASDKGFKTTIRVITRGDRTLYRVQHSSHKDRQKAEDAVQKLTDAGFDASIVNPN